MKIQRMNLLICGLVLALISCSKSEEILPIPPVPPIQSYIPFAGTIFLDPDIITDTDPTTFKSLTYVGQMQRIMYDRRVNTWITVNPFIFNADYDDGLSIEFQINPEFGDVPQAQIQASKFARVIGRLPTVLRRDVKTSWIHKGVQPFGGGNNNILIHTGQSALYEKDGILEETLVHEGTHSSLDANHAASPGWLNAQVADQRFISTYARDNPSREDVAETFLLYMAVRFRPERISVALKNQIENTIPNRIKYLDSQIFNMYPIK